MNHRCQHFQGIDDSRARAREISRPIGDEDSTLANGVQIGPARQGLQNRQIQFGSLCRVTAAGDDEHLRVCRSQILPANPNRVFSFGRENRFPAGEFYEFGFQWPELKIGSAHSMMKVDRLGEPATDS